MRRGLPTILLIALLAFPAAALGDGAGFNPATKRLESAFTVALSARVNSTNGCYPSESKLAKALPGKTALTGGIKGVKRPNVVYVLKGATNCNNVRLAIRDKKSTYQLDSKIGEIKVIGANRLPELIKQNQGPLRGLKLVTESFKMNVPHRRDRMEAHCPGKSYPLGGGFTTSPLGADGEGVYPHSYERLGAQRGWHVTAWLMDPSAPQNDATRNVNTQAMCAKGLVPYSAPHATAFTLPGQTRTVTARCPKGQVLMSGGYQRFDFLGDGGNYPTESRAVGQKAWTVTGTAYGAYGGELTAIAYCIRSKGSLLTQVSSASTPVAAGAVASATTPSCPKGKRLTSTGFSLAGSQAWYAGSSINGNNTSTANAYGFFGPSGGLTAYGYCLKPGV